MELSKNANIHFLELLNEMVDWSHSLTERNFAEKVWRVHNKLLRRGKYLLAFKVAEKYEKELAYFPMSDREISLSYWLQASMK